MKKYLKKFLIFICLFVVLTVLVKIVDVKAIGANQSLVGFSSLNFWFFNLTGVNMILYYISDWLSIIVILIGIIYGVVGLIQWIKRKKILKVDQNLLSLGIFYLLVFGIYLFFEYFIINYRPVLIDGYLEASYPSSTTLLVITFMITSIDQTNIYIKNKRFKKTVKCVSILYMILMVIFRLSSGVHWLSDIIGSIILSIGLISFYYYLKTIDLSKKL